MVAGRSDDQCRLFGHLVRLAAFGRVLVGCGLIEQVALVGGFPGGCILGATQSVGALRLHQLDQAGQAFGPPIERRAQGGSGTCQPTLEHRPWRGAQRSG